MEYVIELLLGEQKILQKLLKSNDLMRKNMSIASTAMANISQLKQAIKILKHKAIKSQSQI